MQSNSNSDGIVIVIAIVIVIGIVLQQVSMHSFYKVEPNIYGAV